MWDGDEVTLKTNAYRVCQEFLEGPWQAISLQDFKFSKIRGGLSNRLYQCSLPEAKSSEGKCGRVPSEVLLRVCGPMQEDHDVIVRETAIFMLLSEQNLGPKLYGVFPSGRLEQYIPSRTLKSSDMRRMSTVVAREMAKIHALQVPIKKKPTDMWTHMDNWWEYIQTYVNKTGAKESYRQIILSQDFGKEIVWLNSQIQKTKSPVVFCHNDLQGGNILLKNEETDTNEGNLMLIDFEFSNYNYRGFDIANHLLEWCFDYITKDFPFFDMNLQGYPTKEEQLEFIGAYLDQLKKEGVFDGDVSAMEAEKKKILDEVQVFRLASHLLWTFWSIKMAISSTIKFAFWEYGKTRLELYKTHKEEFLSTGFRYIDNCGENGDT